MCICLHLRVILFIELSFKSYTLNICICLHLRDILSLNFQNILSSHLNTIQSMLVDSRGSLNTNNPCGFNFRLPRH